MHELKKVQAERVIVSNVDLPWLVSYENMCGNVAEKTLMAELFMSRGTFCGFSIDDEHGIPLKGAHNVV